MADKWIAGAIKHPGAETRAAKKAHKPLKEYEREHADDPGKAGQRARLGLTLAKIAQQHHGKKS